MTNPMMSALSEQLALIRETLEKSRQDTRATVAEVRAAEVKIVAQDRSLTVSMDSEGRLSAIKFNGTHYQRMAPAELSSVLVETINKARQELTGKINDSMAPWRELKEKTRAAIVDGFASDDRFGPLAEMFMPEQDDKGQKEE
jgi:septal ring factor EnvC (AmiA/AmiB activator)